MENVKKSKHSPLFHIVKKQDVSLANKWIIRGLAIVAAFLICSLISMAMGGTFVSFFSKIFNACFVNMRQGGISQVKVLDLLENTVILLLIALALVPAFKMKFWNIGAEGQIIIGILVCALLQKYLAPAMNIDKSVGMRVLFFIVLFVASMISGGLWGFIPAFFKAKFKTNETLFTLMMNYIALLLTKAVIMIWDPSQGQVTTFQKEAYLPAIGGSQVVLNIIIAVVVAAIIFVYLRFTKHGYEISVVGGSKNTAKYVGINVKKVIMRTMIVSGAVCGLVGCLLLAGEKNNLTATIVSGRGFTGVMIAWISGFGPVEMGLYSLLCAFITKGSRSVNYNSAFPNIMLALFFFTLIACEFFVNYQIRSEKIENWLHAKFPKYYEKKEQKEANSIKPQVVNKEGK